ncbi:hypothetical protein BDA96_02G411800 [Sorghum bicolor]|uniref:Peroxidase n=1 Tax=Sorghum bicolor TaxID=4558 RepID=A0A921RUN3_SORBI|nr:hypothetical protein BDA96_02G411800 [Sorghum bicolor]
MQKMAGLAVLVLVALLAAATAQAQGSYGYGKSPAPAASPPESAPMPPPSSSPPTQTPPPPASPRTRLRFDFYKRSCPYAEEIVREAVRNAINVNPGLGAGLIRMAFHDCFVQGCDGSVLLDPTPANPRPEKLSPANFPSLRGFDVVDAAKAALEKACPGVVSCADVVQFAARDAAFFLSGSKIHYSLPGGRLDGRVSVENETFAFLPGPSFNLSRLIQSFKVKGLSVDDLVVLSGAHTIGLSHCSSFLTVSTPPSDMNPGLAAVLKKQCPANPNFTNDPTVVQDVVTPDKLDNQYYWNVMVLENAGIRGRFERKFARAMLKMSFIEVKNAANGEIRKSCHVAN